MSLHTDDISDRKLRRRASHVLASARPQRRLTAVLGRMVQTVARRVPHSVDTRRLRKLPAPGAPSAGSQPANRPGVPANKPANLRRCGSTSAPPAGDQDTARRAYPRLRARRVQPAQRDRPLPLRSVSY
ncbi:hypothetical protein PsYK624_051150 [Phanerochaete sordida]|uniref:Uncharacterized protein n=1 Tax=Phanerochaete sordida TaxID=48140 RepID=A0A9P3G7Q6_9APHY|nr:hypothetical protein PsYK624_051150 [Phanerochaete sordida]